MKVVRLCEPADITIVPDGSYLLAHSNSHRILSCLVSGLDAACTVIAGTGVSDSALTKDRGDAATHGLDHRVIFRVDP